MAVRHYEAGEEIFVEGSPSTSVLRIIGGSVEVTKRIEGGRVLLGRLGPGEFVGEMGVILGQKRGAGVRASEPVTAEEYGREAFLEKISGDSATAFQLLLRLSERLNALDRAFAEAVEGGERMARAAALPRAEEPTVAASGLALKPGTQQVAGALPSRGVEIAELPYVVGRRPRRGESNPRLKVHLQLDDRTPFRLSRAHFQVETGRGGPRVRDLGSVLGTQVNGRPIGRHFGADAALLEPGENAIIAGGEDSPFHFLLWARGS